MNKEDANKEARKVFEQWQKKKHRIEKEAKENGTWNKDGIDSNNHLFKEIDAEAKAKLKSIASLIDE